MCKFIFLFWLLIQLPCTQTKEPPKKRKVIKEVLAVNFIISVSKNKKNTLHNYFIPLHFSNL
jgi:hypothetical protein